jgi:hypothetical protein
MPLALGEESRAHVAVGGLNPLAIGVDQHLDREHVLTTKLPVEVCRGLAGVEVNPEVSIP